MVLHTHIVLIQCCYQFGRSSMADLRRFRTLNDLGADPCCLRAFQKVTAKFEAIGSGRG